MDEAEKLSERTGRWVHAIAEEPDAQGVDLVLLARMGDEPSLHACRTQLFSVASAEQALSTVICMLAATLGAMAAHHPRLRPIVEREVGRALDGTTRRREFAG